MTAIDFPIAPCEVNAFHNYLVLQLIGKAVLM
jgi:hypothetical protein